MSNNEEFIFFFKSLSNKGAGGILFLVISLSLFLTISLSSSLYDEHIKQKKLKFNPFLFPSKHRSIDRTLKTFCDLMESFWALFLSECGMLRFYLF